MSTLIKIKPIKEKPTNTYPYLLELNILLHNKRTHEFEQRIPDKQMKTCA